MSLRTKYLNLKMLNGCGEILTMHETSTDSMLTRHSSMFSAERKNGLKVKSLISGDFQKKHLKYSKW